MDFKAISQAAEKYKKIIALCKNVGAEFLPKKADGTVLALKEVFRIDTAMLMMFLSATDGTLSRSEVDLMDAVTGHNTDAKVLAGFIKEYKLNSVKFAAKTPKALQIAVKFGKEKTDFSLAREMVEFFGDFGALLIDSYNGVEKSEKAGLEIYLANLEAYIKKHLTI